MERIRAFWQSGWIGKIVLGGAGLIGIFVFCCIALVVIGLANPRPTAQAPSSTVIVSEPTSAPAPTEAPVLPTLPPPTSEPVPTATAEPTPTIILTALPPTDAPTITPEPATATSETTPVPTQRPASTSRPIPATQAPKPIAIAPTAHATIPPAADVGAYPCQVGQIKGNRRSHIFHAPGQRDYDKTQADVECFDTEAQHWQRVIERPNAKQGKRAAITRSPPEGY